MFDARARGQHARMRTINLIVIHCSASPSGRAVSRGLPGQLGHLSAAQVFDGWHAERGFKRPAEARARFNPQLKSLGYHHVIDLDGAVQPGRHPDEVGAHAAMFNAHSLGICLVGGQERVGRYSAAQWDALGQLVRSLCLRHSIALAPARKVTKASSPAHSFVHGVMGHRDLSPDKNGNGLAEPFEWLKTCPGFEVRDWLKDTRAPLAAHLLEAAP